MTTHPQIWAGPGLQHAPLREKISLLADGQLQGAEFAAAMDLLATDPLARATWHELHLVGDVMRSVELGGTLDDAGFVEKFRSKLAAHNSGAETVPAEKSYAIKNIPVREYSTGTNGINGFENSKLTSANDTNFRWRLVAGVAALAAVGAVTWSAVMGGGPAGAPQLASAPAVASPTQAMVPAAVAAAVAMAPPEPLVMIRDPHLDALMAAHKQFGGTSALQMPAGFLRNATFESNNR